MQYITHSHFKSLRSKDLLTTSLFCLEYLVKFVICPLSTTGDESPQCVYAATEVQLRVELCNADESCILLCRVDFIGSRVACTLGVCRHNS